MVTATKDGLGEIEKFNGDEFAQWEEEFGQLETVAKRRPSRSGDPRDRRRTCHRADRRDRRRSKPENARPQRISGLRPAHTSACTKSETGGPKMPAYSAVCRCLQASFWQLRQQTGIIAGWPYEAFKVAQKGTARSVACRCFLSDVSLNDCFMPVWPQHESSFCLGRQKSFFCGCGGRIRTCDLRVMSPTSYQLLHPRCGCSTGARPDSNRHGLESRF